MKLVMNRNFLLQKITSVTLVFFIALTIMPMWEFSTYAEEAVQAEETKSAEEWEIGEHSWVKNASNFSVDTYSKYAGKNSIKIKNDKYTVSYVERTFSVKPNTLYKFSAMVKYSGYSLNPENSGKSSGASVGIAFSYDHSSYTTKGDWTKVEYIFDSKDNTEITLALYNGMFGALCKGTAYFSNIKLEENTTERSNEWNVLVVIFKNVKTPAVKDGKKYSFSGSFSDGDIEKLKIPLKKLYTTFDSISDGQMTVGNITVAVPDTTLTSLQQDDTYGYMIDPYDKQVSKILDNYLAKKVYNQIIVISPIAKIAVGWSGLGGTQYKGINFCQTNCVPGIDSVFSEGIYVHEMLHGMESNSNDVDPEKTAVLHSAEDYGYDDNGKEPADGWKQFYTDYMRSELPDGKGLDPSVFQVYNKYKFVVVSDDMTVSDKISA